MPDAYAGLFQDRQDLLGSHRGYDIGALELFQDLKTLGNKSFYAETTRLLVELNRSPHHRHLFSAVTRELPQNEQKHIVQTYYFPYRDQVEHLIHDFVMAGRQVLHLSVHTFTPVLEGAERQTDIGLLYDPKRTLEQSFCRAWKKQLQQEEASLQVRFNYPYLGIADGFPTYLRRKFTEGQYAGVELEVNQKYPLGDRGAWARVRGAIRESLSKTLASFKSGEQ